MSEEKNGGLMEINEVENLFLGDSIQVIVTSVTARYEVEMVLTVGIDVIIASESVDSIFISRKTLDATSTLVAYASLVLDEIYDLIAAGTDTTSATMEWAIAELLHSPQKLAKAQTEVHQVIGKGKPIEESDFAKLPYLRAIIKETLRMHPAVPLLLPRKTLADVEIGGYIVPKGAQVVINAWSIGRDSSVWDNPDVFMPERFLGSETDVSGRSFELVPFGGGRRICPGILLAIRMLRLMLGCVLNCFEWRLEDGVVPETKNMDDKFGITMQMARSLMAVPV